MTFFASGGAFRSWLAANHSSSVELWVGLHRKGSEEPSLTYPEALDEALYFGWIDGVRKRVDAASYAIRFTPRRTESVWSAKNVRRAQELRDLGRMEASGLLAFEARDEERARETARERERWELGDELRQRFAAAEEAWRFFEAQPPSYRKSAAGWVSSAKLEATRRRRLAILIEASAAGRRLDLLAPGRGGG